MMNTSYLLMSRHLYLVSFLQGPGTVFLLSICVTLCCVPTNCSYLRLALAKSPHCQTYHIFLARPQGSCTLEAKNFQMPGAVSGRGLVMIRVFTNYFTYGCPNRGTEFDKTRDNKLTFEKIV